jgi:hypothetical protein
MDRSDKWALQINEIAKKTTPKENHALSAWTQHTTCKLACDISNELVLYAAGPGVERVLIVDIYDNS